MTNQRIRFFAMSLKGLTSYYNCVNRQRRVLQSFSLSYYSSTGCSLKAVRLLCALSLQYTPHENAHVRSPAYELLLS
ncbi:hypothetical protein CIG19_04785 [Enterobacterales bacterium CwR94]|nr:hypothetical protein CIG19_04785 [Enterobacterales bacterium CwR94]